MAEEEQQTKISEYTIETFQTAYDLPLAKAVELFQRFRPSAFNLDAAVRAMKNRGAFDAWVGR
jgi:hypothetical protein